MTAFSATAATLKATFAKATLGDQVALAGALGPADKAPIPAGITLDLKAAVITGWRLGRVVGVTFREGLVRSEGGFASGLEIDEVEDVTFDGVRFEGPGVAGEPATGYGLKVIKGRKLAVRNCPILGLRGGLNLQNVVDLVVERNPFSGLGGDGVALGGCEDVRILRNSVGGHVPLPDVHPDGVQLLKPSPGRHGPCRRVLIADNTFIGPIQGVLCEAAEGVEIRDNVVVAGHSGAISATACKGVTLRDNTVATLPGAPHIANFDLRGSTDVTWIGRNAYAAHGRHEGKVLSGGGDHAAELADAKASIASLKEINERLAAQRDTYRASAIEGVGRLNQIAELAKVSPLT